MSTRSGQCFYLFIFYFIYFSGSSGSISEVNVEAKRRSKDPRIEFVEGTRPPRVQKVGYNSYLNGRLYVGDEVIRLNDTVEF